MSNEAWKTFKGLEKVFGQSNKSFNLKIGGIETGLEAGRDTGNNFFVLQISGSSVTFPGTCIVG